MPDAELMPLWLENYKPGDPFDRHGFFGARTVYYPGSGTDGQPVKVFGERRWAHSFIYVDYGLPEASLTDTLDNPRDGFSHYYNTLGRLQLSMLDLVPSPIQRNMSYPRMAESSRTRNQVGSGFGFLEILEHNGRRFNIDRPERLAIMFLGGDGFATFNALYCQQDSIAPPFAAVIEDYGWGDNWDRFGPDGFLHSLATQGDAIPPWIWAAEDRFAWPNFFEVMGTEAPNGGMHQVVRRLYEHRAAVNAEVNRSLGALNT